jgi:uncharacterized protein YfaP (DUF2135 family)
VRWRLTIHVWVDVYGRMYAVDLHNVAPDQNAAWVGERSTASSITLETRKNGDSMATMLWRDSEESLARAIGASVAA